MEEIYMENDGKTLYVAWASSDAGDIEEINFKDESDLCFYIRDWMDNEKEAEIKYKLNNLNEEYEEYLEEEYDDDAEEVAKKIEEIEKNSEKWVEETFEFPTEKGISEEVKRVWEKLQELKKSGKCFSEAPSIPVEVDNFDERVITFEGLPSHMYAKFFWVCEE